MLRIEVAEFDKSILRVIHHTLNKIEMSWSSKDINILKIQDIYILIIKGILEIT